MELFDGCGGVGGFGPFVGCWAVSLLGGPVFVSRGRLGFRRTGGYVWLRYWLWHCGPKAGDVVCSGGRVLVQVELQRWWPNRVPLAWVIVRGVEVDALLSGPAVVGQDGVRDGGVAVVSKRVVGSGVVSERGSNGRSQCSDVSVRYYVVPCCAGRGIRSARVSLQDRRFVLGSVL